MHHHARFSELSAYCDRELPVRVQERVEKHLKVCRPCREVCDGVSRVARAIQRLPRHKAPESLVYAIRRRISEDVPERRLRRPVLL